MPCSSMLGLTTSDGDMSLNNENKRTFNGKTKQTEQTFILKTKQNLKTRQETETLQLNFKKFSISLGTKVRAENC